MRRCSQPSRAGGNDVVGAVVAVDLAELVQVIIDGVDVASAVGLAPLASEESVTISVGQGEAVASEQNLIKFQVIN